MISDLVSRYDYVDVKSTPAKAKAKPENRSNGGSEMVRDSSTQPMLPRDLSSISTLRPMGLAPENIELK